MQPNPHDNRVPRLCGQKEKNKKEEGEKKEGQGKYPSPDQSNMFNDERVYLFVSLEAGGYPWGRRMVSHILKSFVFFLHHQVEPLVFFFLLPNYKLLVILFFFFLTYNFYTMSRVYFTTTFQHNSFPIPTSSIETNDHTGGGYEIGGLHPTSIAALLGKGPDIKPGERFDLKFNVNKKRTSLSLVVFTMKHLPHVEWSSNGGMGTYISPSPSCFLFYLPSLQSHCADCLTITKKDDYH